jgi:two-component system NtrC family response regulator
MNRILIIDDELSMLRGIEFHLREIAEYDILTASDRPTAMEILESQEIQLVVTDLMLPNIEDGLTIMRFAKKQWYQPSVLAMTAFESVENAVATMQAGADDFVSKGFGLDELTLRINNLLKKKNEIDRLAIENRILRETIQKQFSDFQIIGKSPKMLRLLKDVEKVAADARATCLIEGESGTGKDLVARTIHALSVRREAPFVPINCAAIPESLIESELFGHEKGAFTGAFETKQGKFEHARGGIIFLDEIAELPLHLQVRLLRVLEERSFYRIGGKHPIDVDVMVISATNRNLKKLVRAEEFREDLYFRLNVVTITVPPLRERPQDIGDLAIFFLEKFNRERNRQLKFGEKALQELKLYDFPGNVRELRNIVEDAFVFNDGTIIEPKNLSFRKAPQLSKEKLNETNLPLALELIQGNLKNATEKFEKAYFNHLLDSSHWNIAEVARIAGLKRESLSRKLKRLGLKQA